MCRLRKAEEESFRGQGSPPQAAPPQHNVVDQSRKLWRYSMRKLMTGLIVLIAATATVGLAQDTKPRAYTLVVSGAR